MPPTVLRPALSDSASRWIISISLCNILDFDFHSILLFHPPIWFNSVGRWDWKNVQIAGKYWVQYFSMSLSALFLFLIFYILFIVFAFFDLHLNLPKIELILVILTQNNFKHVVKQFLFFAWFCDCWAWLEVRNLIDLVRLRWLYNRPPDWDKWLAWVWLLLTSEVP